MSYSLRNKYTVIVALAYIAAASISYSDFAQAEDVEAKPAVVAEENINLDSDKESLDEDFFGLENQDENKINENELSAELEDVLSENNVSDNNSESQDIAAKDTLKESEQTNNSKQVKDSEQQKSEDLFLDDTLDAELNVSDEDDAEMKALLSENESELVPPEPKSPFENFGNAILSKVDNDLFTQMSNIEKQNTILNLQLKREELRNKVEALRTARQRAREEEEARRRAEEERLKDLEAERQAKILAEEAKLKEKEMELEKVRQGRIINEYMNEMLLKNQEWIEKNAILQNRIHELENERVTLIKEFENKQDATLKQTLEVNEAVQKALQAHQRIVSAFNAEIAQLRQSVIDTETRLKQAIEGNAENNPFSEATIDQNAIDMSQEYAIMDITGKGKDIVAKIVSRDGTTFIVHKGSMLKGGEVVTTISDNYIAFDNKGVKSYLYTGGTVMEYEPVKTFNGSDKTPVETTKMSIKGDTHNIRGSGSGAPVANTQTAKVISETSSDAQAKSSSGSSTMSVSKGMFVK